MKRIITYLIVWLVAIVVVSVIDEVMEMPVWYVKNLLFIKCGLIGAMGGVLYCLRGVYLNRCVRKTWNEDWHVWYYLRPITSGLSGFVSCIFLKAGLLVLEGESVSGETAFGYLAIAFIAGYNVDNFLKKLESVAKTLWGIEKSRSSEIGEDEDTTGE